MTSIHNTRRNKRSQKGSTFVETALVLLALTSMIIFIMDMGRILLMQQYVSERVRVTVRQAVVNNWSSDSTKNYLVYNSTTAPDDNPPGYLGLRTSQVSYQTLGIPGNPDYRFQVKVSGVPALTWIPYISGSYTLAPVVATLPAQSLGATN